MLLIEINDEKFKKCSNEPHRFNLEKIPKDFRVSIFDKIYLKDP